MENPLKYFAELRDPRVERNREHLLEETLLIAIAAVLSGAESWNDIEDYGEAKLARLNSIVRRHWHRKQAALGTRCRLPRRLQPQMNRQSYPELLHHQPPCTQLA
ncbi:MAG: transposase family protein [Edaphobacter sp.]